MSWVTPSISAMRAARHTNQRKGLLEHCASPWSFLAQGAQCRKRQEWRRSPNRVPPDLGESEAMLAMVRQFAIPGSSTRDQGDHEWMGSGLTPMVTGAKPSPRKSKAKTILTAAKENFGPYEVTLAACGGLDRDVAQLTPTATTPPATPTAQGMLEWARSQGIGINMWSVHGGPNPWCYGSVLPSTFRLAGRRQQLHLSNQSGLHGLALQTW